MQKIVYSGMTMQKTNETTFLKEAALCLAKAKNAYLLRGVLDYLWFQKMNHVSKSGGANYRLLYEKGPWSVSALDFIENQGNSRDWGKSLVKDHAIPHKIIAARLIASPDLANLESILDAMHYVVITKSDDARLRELKLKDRMPASWEWNDAWQARYDESGIVVISKR